MSEQHAERAADEPGASWQPAVEQIRALSERVLWAELAAEDVEHVRARLAEINQYVAGRAGDEPPLRTTFRSGRPVKDSVVHGFRRRSMVAGDEHPMAPPMRFSVDEDGNALGRVRLGRAYQGPPGRCHGGYVAVLLDHIFGAVGAHTLPGPFFTKTLTVVYDAGVPLLQDLEVIGSVDRIEGRKAFVRGEIRHNGEVCAHGTGLLVIPRNIADLTDEA